MHAQAPATCDDVLDATFAGLFDSVVKLLVEELRNRPIFETRGKHWEDTVFAGMLQTLSFLFRYVPYDRCVYACV